MQKHCETSSVQHVSPKSVEDLSSLSFLWTSNWSLYALRCATLKTGKEIRCVAEFPENLVDLDSRGLCWALLASFEGNRTHWHSLRSTWHHLDTLSPACTKQCACWQIHRGKLSKKHKLSVINKTTHHKNYHYQCKFTSKGAEPKVRNQRCGNRRALKD